MFIYFYRLCGAVVRCLITTTLPIPAVIALFAAVFLFRLAGKIAYKLMQPGLPQPSAYAHKRS